MNDTKSGEFVDPITGDSDPKRIQKSLKEPWVKKDIDKAFDILGEKKK